MRNSGKKKNNNKKNEGARVFTRETFGLVLALFTLVALVMFVSRGAIFGAVGEAVSSFLLGVFGYGTFVVAALLVYASVALVSGKTIKAPVGAVVTASLFVLFAFCLAHTITAAVAGIPYEGYGTYLGDCFAAGEGGFASSTAGGALCGLIVYPVVRLTTAVGGYIIFSLFALAAAYFLYVGLRDGSASAPRARAARQRAADHRKEGSASASAGSYAGEASAAPVQPPQTADPYYPQDAAQPPQQPARARQPQQPSAPYYPQQPVQGMAQPAQDRHLYVGDDAFSFKTRRELRQESRREREERRAREEEEKLSPEERVHRLLYPDRPMPKFGGKQQPKRQAPAPGGSAAAQVPAQNSYIKNGIYDESSYFNNPTRGTISREQYSQNFSNTRSILEGHELSSPRSPIPQPVDPSLQQQPEPPQAEEAQPPQQPETFSQMFGDAPADPPKKILTDTSRPSAPAQPDVPVSTYQSDGNFYRREEQPDGFTPGNIDTHRPISSFLDGSFASDRGTDAGISSHDVQLSGADEEPGIDVSDFARRVGLGGAASRRTARPDPLFTQPEETARGRRTDNFPPRARLTEDFSREVFPPAEQEPPRGIFPAEAESSRGIFPAEQEPARGIFPPAEERGGLRGETAREERPFGRGQDRPAEERPFGRGQDLPAEEQPAAPQQAADGRLSRFPTEDGIIIGDRAARGAAPAPQEPPAAPEQSALQPVTPELDSAMFDDEPPMPSAVPGAVDALAASEAERGRRASARDRVQEEERRPRHVYPRYNPPPLSLLHDYSNARADDAAEVQQNKETIVETLYNLLRIETQVVRVTQGPSVTRYDIEIPANVQTSRVLGCDRELAMRLRAKDGVNIQTNYENGSISIEVPNKQRATVGLKEILLAPEFAKAKPGALMFGMGKDIEGRSVCGDISKMKHLLVAGATGSGKSVCLTALIISLLFKYSPEELRLILIDPKQTEFSVYEKLPHLMINEIISDPAKVIPVLNWAINEMERRYTLFRERTRQGTMVRDIDGYNASLTPDEEKLPKIVIIMDEVADLMAVAKKDVEDRVQRLTQKSRAAGIHLVLATQRPSTDVITGVIKANLPTRIACKVTQEVDSRTILDSSGAEKLLGKGDMLYKTDTMTFPRRLQGAWMDDAEVQEIVSYVKEHNEAYFDERVYDFINGERGGGFGGDGDDSVEAVYIEALKYVVSIGQASISMIQRRCSVGYPKAGKIIEWMENMGYISAFDGSKARKVLLTQEEFDNKYGDYGV